MKRSQVLEQIHERKLRRHKRSVVVQRCLEKQLAFPSFKRFLDALVHNSKPFLGHNRVLNLILLLAKPLLLPVIELSKEMRPDLMVQHASNPVPPVLHGRFDVDFRHLGLRVMRHTRWRDQVRAVIYTDKILNPQFFHISKHKFFSLFLSQNISFKIQVLFFRAEFFLERLENSNTLLEKF